jgi:hypothetical protein
MTVASDRQVEVTDDAAAGGVANPRRTRLDAQGRPITADTDEQEA